MIFEANSVYHIYNRGINRQKIFFQKRNYHYFLRKLKKYLYPYCDILAYCLMPNHFHLLINTDERSVVPIAINRLQRNPISEAFRITLSTYTQGINKQEGRKSSLFQQNTKAKLVTDWSNNRHYADMCFYYIHYNPVKAELVRHPSFWNYSSYAPIYSHQGHFLVNISKVKQLIDLDWNRVAYVNHSVKNQVGTYMPWLGIQDQSYFYIQ